MRLLSIIMFVLTLVSTPAHATLLLIVSESGGMFGGIDLLMERFGADIIHAQIGKQYRKSFAWYSATGIPFQDYWNVVMSIRQPGEKIDVFKMEHGPNDEAFSQLEGKVQIPPNVIRRYFSTACSNWGEFSANSDGSRLDIDWRNQKLRAELDALAIEEYIIHANDNGMFMELPLIAQELRKNPESWLKAAVKVYDRADSMLVPFVKAMSGKSKTLDGFFDRMWTIMLISRPVLGGTELARLAPELNARDMLNDGSGEIMLPPNAAFAKALSENLSGVFQGDEMINRAMDAKNASLSRAIQSAGGLLADMLEAYSSKGNGCADVAPFQNLIAGLLVRNDGLSPRFTSICVNRNSKDDISINWTFNLTPESKQWIRAGLRESQVRAQDQWVVKIPKDILEVDDFEVTAVNVSYDGGLRIRRVKDRVEIYLKGMSVSIHVADAPKIANAVTRYIGLRRLTLNDKEQFKVALSGGLFNFPVAAQGYNDEEGPNLQTIRVLGIPFHLE